MELRIIQAENGYILIREDILNDEDTRFYTGKEQIVVQILKLLRAGDIRGGKLVTGRAHKNSVISIVQNVFADKVSQRGDLKFTVFV